MSAEKIKHKGNKDITHYRPTNWLDPFDRMEEMFDSFMHRPFGRSLWSGFPRIMEDFEMRPGVDIYEEGNNILVKADLPGMTKDDIEINLTENTLTLSGEKKKEEKIERKDYYRMERTCGSFTRTFTLPAEIKSEKVKASFKNGTLEIKIPKAEPGKKKGHKIHIE